MTDSYFLDELRLFEARTEIEAKINYPRYILTGAFAGLYTYSMADPDYLMKAVLMTGADFLGDSLSQALDMAGITNSTSSDAMMKFNRGALAVLSNYYLNKRQLRLPDLNSNALKTGVISVVASELSYPYLKDKYDNMAKKDCGCASTPSPSI